jgi:hypothetical protein
MARPKKLEESTPIHTRLTTAQRTGFQEYLRRQQEQVKHTGVQLTEAAVLRGMVLRCLDLEKITHQGPQQDLLSTAPRPAPSTPIAPSAPAPSSPPAALVTKATTEIAEPPAPPKVDTAPPAEAEPEAKPSRAPAKSAPAPKKASAPKAKPTTKTSKTPKIAAPKSKTAAPKSKTAKKRAR